MKKILISISLIFTFYFSIFNLSGCGYAIHGKVSLPFDSIQVGKIENTTLEPKLQDKLQMALTEEFLKQGIDVNPNAGYKLSGMINQFELRILSEKGGIATEYEVVIKGSFSLVDPSGNTEDFRNIGSPFIVSFQSSDTLELENVLALKEIVSERAIRDMAIEIVSILIYHVRK